MFGNALFVLRIVLDLQIALLICDCNSKRSVTLEGQVIKQLGFELVAVTSKHVILNLISSGNRCIAC